MTLTLVLSWEASLIPASGSWSESHSKTAHGEFVQRDRFAGELARCGGKTHQRRCSWEEMLISIHSLKQPSISTDVAAQTDVRCYTRICLLDTSTHAAGRSSSRDALSENRLMVFSFTPSQTRPCTLFCSNPDWWAQCHWSPPRNICADFPHML